MSDFQLGRIEFDQSNSRGVPMHRPIDKPIPRQIELFTPENTIAEVRFTDIPGWTKEQREAISIWLRNQADALVVKDPAVWDPSYRAMYFK